MHLHLYVTVFVASVDVCVASPLAPVSRNLFMFSKVISEVKAVDLRCFVKFVPIQCSLVLPMALFQVETDA